jgi:hypothetical protein
MIGFIGHRNTMNTFLMYLTRRQCPTLSALFFRKILWKMEPQLWAVGVVVLLHHVYIFG